jgi:hypothetical protein
MSAGVGLADHQFVGRLERKFRRAGAEDLVILLTNGRTGPLPASGIVLEEGFSVSVAVEYRGHWAKVSRPQTAVDLPEDQKGKKLYREDLSGPYPWESRNPLRTAPGSIFAMHVEYEADGRRLFHGDTYVQAERGIEPL